MSHVPVFVLALMLAGLVLALARERRLRRALEQLLKRLLSRWRPHEPNSRSTQDRAGDADPLPRL